MKDRGPEYRAQSDGDFVDAALRSILSSERLGQSDRELLRDRVVGRIRDGRRRRRRLFALSLLPAAAAGILIGVLLMRALQPPDGPEIDRSAGLHLTKKRVGSRQDPDRLSPDGQAKSPAAPGRPVQHASPSGIPAPPVIQGTVLDANRTPVPGALVRGLREYPGQVTRVDATGHFCLRLSPLPLLHSLLLISAPQSQGLRDILYRIEAGPGEETSLIRLRMEPGHALEGVVVDGETHLSLENALVEMSVFWGGQQIVTEAVVSTRGGFRLKPPPTFQSPRTPAPRSSTIPEPPAPYQGEEMLATAPALVLQVMIQCRGYIPRLMRFTNPADLAAAFASPVRLDPGGRLSVKVATASGRPLPGTLVRLYPTVSHPKHFLYKAPHGPRTNHQGLVAFEGIPPGTILVEALHPEAIRQAGVETTVSPRNTTRLAISLTRGERLSGRVTDTRGTPIPGAVLYALPDPPLTGGKPALAQGPAITRSDGRFLLPGLQPGTYAVHAYHFPASGPEAVAQVIQGLHTNGQDLRIAMERSSIDVHLSVRDGHDARPVNNISVTLLGPGGRSLRRPERTPDGRWILQGISPSRTALQVHSPHHLPSRIHRFRPALGRGPLTLAVRLYRPSHITGVVVDRSGRPLSGVIVAGGREEMEPIRPDQRGFHAAGLARSTTTDAAGRFILTGLDVMEEPWLNTPAEGFSLRLLAPGEPPYMHGGIHLRQGEGLEGMRIVVPWKSSRVTPVR